MRIKSVFLMMLAAIIGIFFCFFTVIAQKNNVEKNTMQGKTELDSIQKSVLGKAFYELLSVSENNKWILLKTSYEDIPDLLGGNQINSTYLKIKEDETKALVFLTEFKTKEDAKNSGFIEISQGSVEITKDFGDEGRKIYGMRGFSSIEFRKDKFFVSIYCDSEIEAKKLAKYILTGIIQG